MSKKPNVIFVFGDQWGDGGTKPKFEISLLRSLCKQAGMISPDERVYKMMSVLMEQKMNEILKEVMAMNSQS